MQIYVIGGDGFIGRNVCERLRMDDHQLNIDFQFGRQLPRCDVVIHLGAISGIEACNKDPLTAIEVNVDQTARVLEAIRQQAPRVPFLFASSKAVLGDPLSLYGATKRASEALIQGYRDAYALRTTILRFANVYGRHSLEKSSVIAQFMRATLKGGPLPIHAGAENQRRDFLYVWDIADLIADLIGDPRPGQTWTLNGPEILTIGELAWAFQTRNWARSHGVPNNPIGANQYVGKTLIADGLARTYDWFAANMGAGVRA